MKCSVCESSDISSLEIDGILFCRCKSCYHKWRQLVIAKWAEKPSMTEWILDPGEYPLERPK